jgi:hypothetical protein
MRNSIFIALFLSIIFSAGASPVDSAYDLLDAITYQNGYALEDILSHDLYQTITGFLDQVRSLVETDPVLAASLLNERYRGGITIEDFEVLTNQELLGKLMLEASLQSNDQIQQETAEMQGRNATVVISYLNGASISFSMVWENSKWRVSDSSLLGTVFR